MAMGLRIFSSIFLFVTIGMGLLMGITYYVTRSFLKREFEKKFKKMDEEQQAQLRRIRREPESEDEQD